MKEAIFYRNFEFDRSTLNEEERSIDMSLTSETPVRRFFGDEILLHGRENVDLSRLNSALLNHDPNQIIGRWEEKRIEKKVLRARLYFDADPEGERAMAKVKSGSLKGASGRYFISKFRELREGEEWNGLRGPAYVATRWGPVEGSLTPIPADHTVGVGRDATRSLDGIEIERSQERIVEMTPEEVRQIIEEEREKSAKVIADMVRAQLAEDNKPKMRVTPDEFSDLLSRATAVSPAAVVEMSRMVAEGQDSRAIEKKLFDLLAAGNVDARDAGGADSEPGGSSSKTEEKRDLSSFEKVDDDLLARSIANPTAMID